MNRQEPLGLSSRLLPSHLSCSLSGWLMRNLTPIVRVASGVVIHGRHDVSVGGAVAPQLVRNQLPRLVPLPLQKLAEEPSGRAGIAISLYQDVDHVSVLIDSPPEIMPLSLDVHEELIQVPDVSQATLPTPEIPGVPGVRTSDTTAGSSRGRPRFLAPKGAPQRLGSSGRIDGTARRRDR